MPHPALRRILPVVASLAIAAPLFAAPGPRGAGDVAGIPGSPLTVPWPIVLFVLLTWFMPIPAAIGGWYALRDLPNARRRYRSQAAAWITAYVAILASGWFVGRHDEGGNALLLGMCCVSIMGPIVGLGLLIQPSMLRAGVGGTEPLPDQDEAPDSNSI
ncbi:MAG: hypothetical protein AB8G96_09720 [Phycisphaerales bacterium]